MTEIKKDKRVQNAAARLVAHLGPLDHVTPTLKDVTGYPSNSEPFSSYVC